MPGPRLLPERRREPRLRVSVLINLAPHVAGARTRELILGRTVDLSRSGVRVQLHRPLEVGMRVRLSIALRERLVEALGEVRSVMRAGDGYEVGLAFIDIEPPHRDALALFIASRRGREGEASRRRRWAV